MFKTVWEYQKEEPKVINVDKSLPSLVEDCKVLTIPQLIKMSDSININFDGYDEELSDDELLSDDGLFVDDPSVDIADVFAEQQAISQIKDNLKNNHEEEEKLSDGGAPQVKQSQSDTTLPPQAE